MPKTTGWRSGLRRSLWGVADYRNLWMSQTVSLFGTGITLLALPLIALSLLEATPFEIGLLWAFEYLAILLIGLPAGVWVERLPLRAVLVGADLIRAVALLTVPIALLLGVLSMPLLYLVAFLIGLGALFYDVAQLSMLPVLVAEDRLVDANGKLELSRSVAQIGSPAVGGFTVQLLTAPFAVLADAVTYLASAFYALRIRKPAPVAQPVERSSLRKEIREGVRFVFGHSLMRPLLLCATLGELSSAIILAMQVVFATEALFMTPAVIGIALAAGNGGGVVGALVAEPFARRFGTGTAFMVSIVLFTAGSAILPMSTGPVTFAFGMFVAYLGAFIFNVLQVSLCQAVTPPHMLGRMNSVFRFATWGVIPLGAAGGGLLVDYIGLAGVFWLAAALNALSFLPPLFSALPRLREIPHHSVAPDGPSTGQR
ncbi:MFS transporter [Actinoalloteichus hymeniacidonis]|uniref:Arabinose efflux permease family protein n=1 Tax=Actinoalloteichus hymeniacidonis TaxID=340345 RepID=A0AAC9MXA5_9PSEU|nr:MFS transporter [Actinoalloteichus hymeniacidonis]AOS61831.1 arabinose efflux permease family protein [Actinoalloteichus hymeniacidonis]MBB5910149.1 MFS family permease [Actinoalloteichus hymeniacidonis]